jgi:hypothetical protein
LLSPLYCCARNFYTKEAFECAKILLNFGAEMNPKYQSKTNFNIIGILLFNNHTETTIEFVKLFLQYNADINGFYSDENAFTMLDKNHKGPHKKEIFDLLTEHNKKKIKFQ